LALSKGVPLHLVAGRLGERAEMLLATYAQDVGRIDQH
jgi:hypothetical protein